MKDCGLFQRMIEDLVAGVIEVSDREKLNEHCRQCGECRERVKWHEDLDGAGEAMVPEPTASVCDAVRGRVLEEILNRRPPAGSFGGRGYWRDLRDLLRIHPLAIPAGVMVLLVAAIFMGRWSMGLGGRAGDPFLRGLEQLAA
ncbi:MAG: hypothetical protein KJ970_05840 [Candidatus Eisenbacteria bacterium]|uniref:Zinc-finger domain-containing protein n=1 Tax=Eiseniibacteriota bacterium TaxID=2212470 RepID=A0A948W6A4_UNCEI|nr:hypothetical protein [Candidatus Eisenbacteria bacterium]MBU1949358.1 hypothetical protein [Candidatus Eisenbacteria bacterium]MBU2690431.1 hypothetical protein [Candidatus Eisenbacteria bacterium]